MSIDNTDKISVIIPVYNTENYFDRCIRSVLEQSYSNLEIIVVNDGSTGNIDQIISNYLKKDLRIKYVSHECNKGLFRARVTGMHNATGEYVAFIDSDDYVSHDFYRTLITRAQDMNADMVIAKTVWDNQGERYIYNYHESCFQFEKLEGDQVKQEYYRQENSCYSWHTVWNKLYRADLIRKCLPEFEEIKDHIVMTEDIAFSSVFFYKAGLVTTVGEEAYFYCVNEEASTNTTAISIDRFLKNLRDMIKVFDFVDAFLEGKKSSKDIRCHFKNARKHYASMWCHLLNSAFDKADRKRGLAELNKFCEEYETEFPQRIFYFESFKTPWKGALEYLKEEIKNSKESYISFDIFDTLILRPFFEPGQVLSFLDPIYTGMTATGVSFSRIRKDAEDGARRREASRGFNKQDITLTEIYQYICDNYSIPKSVCRKMMEEECRLEVRFSCPRNAGRSLLSFAKAIGKKVILVTDMYLERGTIEDILDKNGISGYEKLFISCEEGKLKYNGSLFESVIKKLNCSKDDILHIGDTWQSDVEGCQKAGIRSIFFPKTKDVFEDRIKDYTVNQCGRLADLAGWPCIQTDQMKKNFGLGSMFAMVANFYFDNPYRDFHPKSDLNSDPYFIGYYVIGMHLIGLCKWIDQQVREKKCGAIHFLSRDGFLPMKAYEQYIKSSGTKVNISYLYTSRKAMMPFIVEDRTSFYQLPIEILAHTPLSLLRLLEFASKDLSTAEIITILKNNGIDPEVYFKSEEEYRRFITCYLDNFYCEEKHQDRRRLIKEYFSVIERNDVTFDMGYSGRIQSCISRACGFGVDALFIHEDYMNSVNAKQKDGFNIISFYDFRPVVTGVFREHIFSEYGRSCIGYEKNRGIRPVFENERKAFQDQWVIEQIHAGALKFVDDFLCFFGNDLSHTDFSPIEASLPMEGFFRFFTKEDIHIFNASFFEDEVYGGRSLINVESFLCSQSYLNKKKPVMDSTAISETIRQDTFMDMMNGKNQFIRGIIWILVDPATFIKKLRTNINRLMKHGE